MGVYASSFRLEEGMRVDEVSNPSQADWITTHAAATSLAIVEVERLWERFKQFGVERNGVLVWADLQKSRTSNDSFMLNMLVTLRDARGDIPFQSFLNAMKWAEISEQETKIRAAFGFLNNGKPVDEETLHGVLKILYVGENEQSIRRTVKLFFQEVDRYHKGFVEEDQFVGWVQKLPQDTLDSLLTFHIVPPEINRDAHRTFTAMRDSTPVPSPVPSQLIPGDVVLEKVARKVHTRDWALLANKLGFTSHDIARFEENEPSDSFLQVYEMLQQWHKREGALAHAGVLETALRESQMNDAAMLLYP